MSLLENYFSRYLSFKSSETGKAWTKEREDKRRLLLRAFSEKMLKEDSDEEFIRALIEALSSLWAMAVWTKREQRINQIIERNGVKKLRDMFYELIYGEGPLEERFDNFLANVWGLGVAAVTEILCFINPEKYAMWNKKVVLAIEKLGLLEELAKTLGLKKNRVMGIQSISGRQYVKIINFLDKLRAKVEQLAKQKVDFLKLDYFLYYIAEVAVTPVIEEEERKNITSHEEAQYYLLKLGQLLGYVTHVAKQDQGKIVNNERLGEVADISELPQWLIYYRSIRNPEDIDVLWLDSTGERLVYAFEVSHTTDITKDATALRDLASIAERLFIVAPDNRRNEFERLSKSAQFGPLLKQGKLRFLSYNELLSLYNKARNLRELLDRVGIRI
jgi:hypothetical protein